MPRKRGRRRKSRGRRGFRPTAGSATPRSKSPTAVRKIVVASLSGFGASGPRAGQASYDIVAQATGGLMALTGFPDGPPVRGGGALGDFVGGLYLALGIVSALLDRDRTGRARVLDLSNQDAVFAITDSAATIYADIGVKSERVGNQHPFTAPYDAHQARDGAFALAEDMADWGFSLEEKYFLAAAVAGTVTDVERIDMNDFTGISLTISAQNIADANAADTIEIVGDGVMTRNGHNTYVPGTDNAWILSHGNLHPSLLGELKHNRQQGGVVDRLAVATRRLEADSLCRLDGGLVKSVTQASQHTEYLELTRCVEDHLEHDLAFDLFAARLLGVGGTRLGYDLDRGVRVLGGAFA